MVKLNEKSSKVSRTNNVQKPRDKNCNFVWWSVVCVNICLSHETSCYVKLSLLRREIHFDEWYPDYLIEYCSKIGLENSVHGIITTDSTSYYYTKQIRFQILELFSVTYRCYRSVLSSWVILFGPYRTNDK